MECTAYQIKHIAQITKVNIVLVKNKERNLVFFQSMFFILLSNDVIVAGEYFLFLFELQICTSTCSQLLDHGI